MGAFFTTLDTTTDSTSVAGGGVAWTHVEYAAVFDGTNYAQASFAGSDLTDWCRGLNFKSWPTWIWERTITGLMCSIYAQCDTADACRVTHCSLYSNAGFTGNDLAAAKPIETVLKEVQIGGDGEMWGLTSDQIKAYTGQKGQGFVFEVEEETGNPANVDIDGMFITIWYNRRIRALGSLGCGI